MKGCVLVASLVILLVFLPSFISARHIGRLGLNHGHKHFSTEAKARDDATTAQRSLNREMMRPTTTARKGKADTVQVAGSSLPDCSHACGSCRPCRLVMVSFVCASLQEAETCPMAYKCMCRNKSYPVP